MGRARQPPAERVRARVARLAGASAAATMAPGYQRLGRVLIVRVPPALEPYRRELGHAWSDELGVETVLGRAGPIEGEFRQPRLELLWGQGTETTVVEHGSRWRLDAARIMFAAGNRFERQRFASLVRPGERVADLFAGIGYFTVPAARREARASFLAVEKNPVAFDYLRENLRENAVDGRVEAVRGDNRSVPLPTGAFDRVLLGYLPSSLPWIGRALELLAPAGGTIHVHLVTDASGAASRAEEEVRREIARWGGELLGPCRGREVKPYGPARAHVVVDVVAGRIR